MKITFHGAAQTVTGSQHLIEINGKKILLDCGLYQGRRADARKRNQDFGFDPKTVDAMVLSHAHIDHSGNIPHLVKAGFRGHIYCTNATRDLAENMLPDSGHIQERDADFFNRKIRKPNAPKIDPLYTEDDAHYSLTYFQPIYYHHKEEILPDVELTFYDAGHMLGSAIVQLRMIDHSDNSEKLLVFSGDLGRHNLPIIRDPEIISAADILIMESTYGNRLHEKDEILETEIEKLVKTAVSRNGAIIIPSFAVGRTQQLVYTFQKLLAKNKIPPIEIFVDSPLATNVTQAFVDNTDVFDDEIRTYMRDHKDKDPFGFGLLTYTRSVEESKALNYKEDPFVVISASGMAEHGRILHHLRNRISEPENIILFAGWQAPHTLGRKVLDGNPYVKIFGHDHTVRAQIEQLTGLSGHADANELVDWADSFITRPKRTFLVHGELTPAKALAKRLKEEANYPQVDIPAIGDSVKV